MNQSNTYNISVRRVPKRSRKDRKEYSASVIVESGGGSSVQVPVMHNDLLNIIDVTEELSDEEKGVHLTGALAKLLVTIDQARLDKWDKQPVGSRNIRVTDTDLGYLIETMDDYISKTKADVAKGHITFEQGVTSSLAHIAELYAGLIEADGATILDAIITNLTSDQGTIRQLQSDNVTAKLIRSSSYAGGATGHGYSINDLGEAELKSLFIREFLEATEFRYNRVTVIAGESWRGPGAGLIKSVDTTAQTITLKLEEGELATIDIDDICKAIYHTPTGFATAFFRITEKVSNDTYKYVLRSGYSMHPQMTMSFIAYGNFTNKARQQSCYEARSYKRYLANVNNWDIQLSNIMMQLGDLSNLKTEHGLDMTGYSAYLNRIYMTGTIKQLSSDGETVVPIPAFKGSWIMGKYWYYDEVTHIGCRWICIAAETTQEPADSATGWIKVVDKGGKGDKGDPGISGAMLRPRGEWKPNTQYVNNNQYRDTVIYNKNKYIVKSTHTSGSSFVSSQWGSFNEFINVATQVLLADQAWIDILGAQGIAVGSDAANRWELTDGKIRHTATGLELTADGKIKAPPGGIVFSNNQTIEDVVDDKVQTSEQAAIDAAKAYSDAADVAQKTILEAYADGIVTAEEQARINDVNAKLAAAKTYADAKANEAKTQANAYADGKVTESEQAAINAAKAYSDAADAAQKAIVEAYADGIVTAEEQARIADAQAKLAEAKKYAEDKANAIEIGGRNLLKNSFKQGGNTELIADGVEIIASNKIDTFFYLIPATDLTSYRSQIITLSFYAQGVASTCSFSWKNRSDSIYHVVLKNGLNTLTLTDDDLGAGIILFDDRRGADQEGNIRLTKFKLEKGNKATDWTPAPEDVDASISATQQAAINAAKTYSDAADIAQKTILEAYADGIVTAEEQSRIADVNAKLAAAKTYAEAKANEAKVQSNAYADGKVTESEQAAINAAKAYSDAADKAQKTILEAYADGIVTAEEQARIADTQAKLAEAKKYAEDKANAIEIGGRNLLLQSKDKRQSTGYLIARYTLSEKWIAGETYTITFKGSVNTPNTIGAWRDKGNAGITTSVSHDGKGNYKMTFKCPEQHPNDSSTNELTFYNFPSGTATAATLELVKLEKGNKATDWTPAPEDVDASISATQQAAINAAKAYSDAADIAQKTILEAYADGVVTAEEQARINDVNAKLAVAKTYAEAKANEAKVQSNAYADGKVTESEQAAINAAKAYSDAADVAQKTILEAYADGVVTAEEQARIADVNAKLAAAKTYAEAKANEAKVQSNAYADGKVTESEQAAINAAKAYSDAADKAQKTILEAYADGIVTAEEQARIADAQAKLAEAKKYAEDKVNAIEIGGRNLLLQSKDKRQSISYLIARYTLSEKWIVGETYTITFKGSVNTPNTIGLWRDGGSIGITARVPHDGKGNYRMTFKCPAAYPSDTAQNTLSFYNYPTGTATSASVELVKLEKGNKATDWTAAPEEIDYLTNAIQGDTSISGGLVMSNVMAVRSGNGTAEEDIVAGMSGLKDDGVFFFADVKNAYRKAVNYFKGLSSDKPLFGVSKSGFFVAMQGLIGCFQVAKDLITIKDSSGADKVKFTGELLDNFASQAQSSSGGTTGSRWIAESNTGSTVRGTTQQVMLTHTFTNGAESIYGIKFAQEQVFVTQVAEEAIGGRASASARVSVNLVLRISQGSTVLHEVSFRQASHDCFTDNMVVNGMGNPSETTRIQATHSLSQRLPKGSIKLELIAFVNYSLVSNRGVNSTFSSAISYLTPQSGGRFDLVSTDDETIIAADGMSVRLNSNNFFKLLKKAGEISLVFRGKVSPDSNVPALICGGEVNSWGNAILKLGDDSKASRSSTGHYIITLPSYMRGKSNYVVQLTGVSTDNLVTRAGVDTAANCFWVQTWQSSGIFEDAGFTYMVYRAK